MIVSEVERRCNTLNDDIYIHHVCLNQFFLADGNSNTKGVAPGVPPPHDGRGVPPPSDGKGVPPPSDGSYAR